MVTYRIFGETLILTDMLLLERVRDGESPVHGM
jgi:hypothetical protein